MEWPERMNSAIDYIENSLDDEIDYNTAAEKAGCSLYHFQRMFFAIIGVTPGEYARRRRLTMAAGELITGNAKVIDVAMKYGYDSPNAFTRAFRNMHGINPGSARGSGIKLTAYPRVSFHIELKGGSSMDYQIIDRPAFKVAGKIREFGTDTERNMKDISSWCEKFMSSAEPGKLKELVGNKTGTVTGGMMLGICFKAGRNDNWSYAIAVELPQGASPSRYETLEIPATKWAVFQTTIDNIGRCWKQIFSEWMPSTGHEHTGQPELEVYMPGDMGPGSRCDIWVPVVKKR